MSEQASKRLSEWICVDMDDVDDDDDGIGIGITCNILFSFAMFILQYLPWFAWMFSLIIATALATLMHCNAWHGIALDRQNKYKSK